MSRMGPHTPGWKQPPSPHTGPPTDDDEDIPLDVCLDVDAATALRVVCAAEAGHVHHAALVDIHHAGWREREQGSGWQGWCHRPLSPPKQAGPPKLG